MCRFVLLPALAVWLGMTAAATAADPPAVLLRAEGQVMQATCSGNDARVEGNHNTIVLAGPCRGLRLNGVANHVTIDLRDGAPVRIEGSANQVIYRVKAGPPTVVALGPDNAVRAESVPPPTVVSLPAAPPQPRPPPQPGASSQPGPAAAGVLDLSGNDQTRIADCTGRDVLVRGLRSAYVLRGGCRSITVQGDLLTIQAEVMPGTRIAIDGAGVVVAWAMVAGATWQDVPMQSVHGRHSRVQRADMIGGQPVR